MKLSLGVFINVFVSKPFYQATQLPILQLLSFNTWTGIYEYIFGVVEPRPSKSWGYRAGCFAAAYPKDLETFKQRIYGRVTPFCNPKALMHCFLKSQEALL